MQLRVQLRIGLSRIGSVTAANQMRSCGGKLDEIPFGFLNESERFERMMCPLSRRKLANKQRCRRHPYTTELSIEAPSWRLHLFILPENCQARMTRNGVDARHES